MGEVWRARDTRLGREVALKVLPGRLAADAGALARFEREARSLAALSHPHICILHDVGHEGGTAFLVMELLAGETLADRLARGSLPLPEALGVAIQVAEALAAAHRLGIVHRDLKPGNVMLVRGQVKQVKLLDFGLAKGINAEGNAVAAASEPPPPLTAAGVLLGTLEYMAPEQLEGRDADDRSDIFALGAIVYEMVSGRRAFPGSSPASVIAAILKDQPRPLRELVPIAAPALDRLVQRCLEKDPDARWQSAADVAEALRWLADPGSGSVTALTEREARPARSSRGRLWVRNAVPAALAVLALGFGWTWWRAQRAAPPRLELALPLPQASGHAEWFQLAPTGDRLAWVGRSSEGVRSLWMRLLAEREERQLAGTEGAMQPFWSPDGRWLGFFADGKLKKVPVAGGAAETLATAASPSGGTWSGDGVIVFSPGLLGRLYRIAADGGEVTPLTELAPEEEAHRWPCFLSDGDHFAFLADSAQAEHHQIRLGSLAGGPAPPLVQAVSQPVCVGGHLLYARSGTLLAQELDVGSARLVGEPTRVAENLDENYANHHWELSVAPGLLAYRSVDPATQFVWVDRRGRVLNTIGEPGRFSSFDLSRDERRLAFARLDADGRVEGVWWRDLDRGTVARVAATSERALVGYPVWSPDATQLALGMATTAQWSLGAVRIGDPAPPRPLLQASVDDFPASWSPDGRWLAFGRSERQEEDSHIWVASIADGSATPFTRDDNNEIHPAFSPDGHWIAYAADPSGRREVYLRRFPEGGPAFQVSRSGGGLPAWRGDGRELYYVSRDLELVAVPLIGHAAALTPGEPEVLFELMAGDRPRVWWEGVAPARDGSRFLALEHVASPARQPIRLVVGWRP